MDISALENIIRTGWVSSVDIPERTARVIFKDKGDPIVSGPLKVLCNPPWIPEYYKPDRTEYESGGSGDAAFASHKHDLKIKPWLPSVGDYVLCIFIPKGEGDGFVIGGIQ